MKTTRLFSFLILISLVSNANAQLRVLSNGRVQAGLLKDNNEDLGNVYFFHADGNRNTVLSSGGSWW